MSEVRLEFGVKLLPLSCDLDDLPLNPGKLRDLGIAPRRLQLNDLHFSSAIFRNKWLIPD